MHPLLFRILQFILQLLDTEYQLIIASSLFLFPFILVFSLLVCLGWDIILRLGKRRSVDEIIAVDKPQVDIIALIG